MVIIDQLLVISKSFQKFWSRCFKWNVRCYCCYHGYRWYSMSGEASLSEWWWMYSSAWRLRLWLSQWHNRPQLRET